MKAVGCSGPATVRTGLAELQVGLSAVKAVKRGEWLCVRNRWSLKAGSDTELACSITQKFARPSGDACEASFVIDHNKRPLRYSYQPPADH